MLPKHQSPTRPADPTSRNREGSCPDPDHAVPPLALLDHVQSVPDSPPTLFGIDWRIHHAVCDLYAYVLVLDAESRRLTCQLDVLVEIGAPARHQTELACRLRKLDEEIASLRDAIVRFREIVDPEGIYL